MLWFTASELSKDNETNAGPPLNIFCGVFDSAEAFPVRSVDRNPIPIPLVARVAVIGAVRTCRNVSL